MSPQHESSFNEPIPAIADDVLKVSFPAEHVLHIAMNRPKAYNAMNAAMERALNVIFDWFGESQRSMSPC